jgi:hypothetical protein
MLIYGHVIGVLPLCIFLFCCENDRDVAKQGGGLARLFFVAIIFSWAYFLDVKRKGKFLKTLFLLLKVVFLHELFRYYFGFWVGVFVGILFLAISAPRDEDDSIISQSQKCKTEKKKKKKKKKYDYLDLQED